MDIKVNDKFTLKSSDGHMYDCKVVNINEFRPPEMMYAISITDENGTPAPDLYFVGEDTFERNADAITWKPREGE